MEWKRPLGKAITGLRNAERALAANLDSVRRILVALEQGDAMPSNPKGASGRRLSSQGRAAISKAAKRRWADYRRAHGAAGK